MKRIETYLVLIALSAVACSCDRVQGHVEDVKGRVEARMHLNAKSDTVLVKVMDVCAQDHSAMTAYVGTVESGRSGNVAAPFPGTLARLCVKEGQKVAKGQTIAVIESQTVRSAYDAAKATLAQAEDGMERLNKLYESGSISDVKMVEMRTNLEKARSSEAAAAKSLSDCNVKAPFSGTVASVPVVQGQEMVISQVIASIVDPNTIEIHFPLPENEFATVNHGDRAEVYIPALDKTVEAKVAVKGVVASRLSHSYDCTLSVAAGSGIMPGMACKVYVRGGSSDGIVIPASAVMTGNAGRYVWVVRDGKVAKVFVEVDGYSGSGVKVSSGLEEGDQVIIEGARKVSTGMSVRTER